METFEMVAKTFQGLEEVLSEELINLGAEDVQVGRRMVSFRGDKRLLYKANLCCRTALRILKPIAKFTASDPDELYDKVRDFDWDSIITSPQKTFSIDSTVNSQEFTHSKFVTYRVKDGIADYFNDKYGSRPSVRLNGADVQLNVHILDSRVTISLDSSGEPLSRRGYRTEQTEAPLNEVLAAGLLLLTGWRGTQDLVDPMCGSGTFLIEAALIAANINPGIFRSNFAFESWPDFDRDLFEELYNDDSEEREPVCRIYGGDIAREAVEISKANIKRAGVEDFVSVECKPMQDWTTPPLDAMLITNPPYDVRLRPGDVEGLYRQIGSTLKNYFEGYHAWILGYKDEHFREIGLKPSAKINVLNGKLECEFREYVLFSGSYDSFRAKGGKVKPSREHDADAPKVKHLSDTQWRKEEKAFAKQGLKERKEFKKEFKKDRHEGASFGKKPFKRDGKPEGKFAPKHESKREFKKPQLSAESETRFASNAAPQMRSRKTWKK